MYHLLFQVFRGSGFRVSGVLGFGGDRATRLACVEDYHYLSFTIITIIIEIYCLPFQVFCISGSGLRVYDS